MGNLYNMLVFNLTEWGKFWERKSHEIEDRRTKNIPISGAHQSDDPSTASAAPLSRTSLPSMSLHPSANNPSINPSTILLHSTIHKFPPSWQQSVAPFLKEQQNTLTPFNSVLWQQVNV